MLTSCLISHNVCIVTRVLHKLGVEGVQIDPEAVAAVSPYFRGLSRAYCPSRKSTSSWRTPAMQGGGRRPDAGRGRAFSSTVRVLFEQPGQKPRLWVARRCGHRRGHKP
jgi:hypothetical protein